MRVIGCTKPTGEMKVILGEYLCSSVGRSQARGTGIPCPRGPLPGAGDVMSYFLLHRLALGTAKRGGRQGGVMGQWHEHLRMGAQARDLPCDVRL